MFSESINSHGMGSTMNLKEDRVFEDDGDNLSGKKFGDYSKMCPHMSTRSKQHISYNENTSYDDEEDAEFVDDKKSTEKIPEPGILKIPTLTSAPSTRTGKKKVLRLLKYMIHWMPCLDSMLGSKKFSLEISSCKSRG
ncbi:Uncharacterized protein Fot_54908 [Forsythia ovata]|uniref:Uncharacterized protein n=1 Tax=Forsythia ovata TaxID=205694 RepID=A0ABD1P7X2_9LAMI